MRGALQRDRLVEVARLFFKLGAISFGGPAASIALMEQETVHKRRWLTPEHFLDLLAATNLVPGPNATEMAVHIGWVHAGWAGLIAGGLAFIVPATATSLALAVVYLRLGSLPQVASLFYGINPAVIAIVLLATYRLGRTAIRDWRSLALSLACLLAVQIARLNEALVLLAAGVVGILLGPAHALPTMLSSLLGVGLFGSALHPTAMWSDERLLRLGAFFLKVGSLLFGSGMVLFAFIHRDVVTRFGWLTEQQLLDAIAVGQITPGPVSSAVTFIGYLVAGVPGALVSTVAMFLPSFVIVTVTGPWIPRLRQSSVAQAFLNGVNAAVVALILAVALDLLRSAVVDVWTGLIFGFALVALTRFRLDSLWLVLGGAVAGLLRYLASGG